MVVKKLSASYSRHFGYTQTLAFASPFDPKLALFEALYQEIKTTSYGRSGQ
jgi:hypothetical protein